MANGLQLTNPNILQNIQQGLAIRQQRQEAPGRREAQGLQLQGARDTARIQSVVQGASILKGIQTPQEKLQFLQQRFDERQEPEVGEALAMAQAGDFEGLERITDQAIQLGRRAGGPTIGFGAQETLKDSEGNLFFATQRRNRNTGELESVVQAIGSGPQQPVGQLKPVSGAGLTPEEKVEQIRKIEKIKTTENERREVAKATTKRKQGFITAGVEAADSAANIRRSVDLLKDIKTGGFASVAQRVKQTLGIEGADEAELTANMGTAVLAQLKPLFGAAFTEAEGARLERLSAGFGKSAAANKRILKQQLKIVERAARRGIAAAEDQKDQFAADEIRKALAFDVTPEVESVKQLSDDELLVF